MFFYFQVNHLDVVSDRRVIRLMGRFGLGRTFVRLRERRQRAYRNATESQQPNQSQTGRWISRLVPPSAKPRQPAQRLPSISLVAGTFSWTPIRCSISASRPVEGQCDGPRVAHWRANLPRGLLKCCDGQRTGTVTLAAPPAVTRA